MTAASAIHWKSGALRTAVVVLIAALLWAFCGADAWH